MSDLTDPIKIQNQLDLCVRANPNGTFSAGTSATLATQILTLKSPLKITSGGKLFGSTGARTVIRFDGKPGTSAILINSYMDHRYVLDVLIHAIDFYCPNGANAVGIDRASTNAVEDVRIVDSYVNGGAIDLGGANYFCLLDQVRFLDPRGKVLTLGGQGHTLRSTRLSGQLKSAVDKPPTCMVDTSGSVTFEGFSRLEGLYGCPLLDAKGMPDGSRGSVTAAGNLWVEPKSKGVPAVRLTNVDYYGATQSGNWPGTEWEKHNSTINVPATSPVS